MRSAIVFACLVGAVAASASTDTNRPFAMRGLELGISKTQFKSFAIPNDDGRIDPVAWCSDDRLPSYARFYPTEAEKADGIVTCKWFSKYPSLPMISPDDHWVDLGMGKGPPVFKFISDGSELRLVEINFFANNDYYPGIYEALLSNYGKPKEMVEPFQTKVGAVFENKKSIWSNSKSTITLIFRCGQTDRYCLTYNHTALNDIWLSKQAARRAGALSKI